MTAPEPSSLDALEPRAPTRRLGVLRFQHQVNAIDELIHDYDPAGVGSAPGDEDDIYEGAAVEVMRALRDSEISGLDAAVAVKTVIPQASHELVTKIVAAWQAG